MGDERVVVVNGATIHFVDVVRGLKSDAKKVIDAFAGVKPELLAMSVSKEELEGLRSFAKEPFEVEMSRYEELYSKNLARFGDVFLPPPCFLAGLEEAGKANVEIVGIDMDDETHTAAYCAHVSGYDLFRHTTRFNILKLRSFKAKTPAEFAKEWDRRVNNLRGFRELEKEREWFMAKELDRIAEENDRKILTIIDLERSEGVRRKFQSLVAEKL